MKYKFFYVCVGILIILVGKLYHPIIYSLGLLYIWFLYSHFGLKICCTYFVLSLVFVACLQYPKMCEEPIVSGTIIAKDEKYIVINHEDAKIKVYGDFLDYRIDDYIKVEVDYFDIAKVRNDNAFNYQRYLYGQGIMQQAYCQNVIEHTSRSTIFTWLQNRIGETSDIENYTSLFLLGIKTEEMEGIYSSLTNLSIVHIFALSGMHIHILKRWIHNILRFFISDKYLTYVILVIIGGYLYCIPENISFLRAYLVMVIYTFGKRYITRLDALAIACMLMFWKNPYVVYNISFIFSYIMYFFVLVLGKYKYDTWLLYIVSIPIILQLQYRLQATAIVLTFIFTPMIKILYMLCLWYIVLGSIISPLIQLVIYVTESMIILSDVLTVYIPFSKPTLFFTFVFYFIIGQAIIKINTKKKCTLEICKVCCLLCIFYLTSRYPIAGKVVMIDVGQGDCFLIKQPLNKGTILIDTGGLKNRDIASDTLIPYLRSEGIVTIDYIFISHDDFDHNGALESLEKQFPITNIITTYQEDMKIGDVVITMYPLQLPTMDTNANSLIFKADINNISYLFTGDIGVEEEQVLYDTYGEIDVDVLKIPHHGSKNSTSYPLLHMTTPKVALISCGENNFYGHPHETVIDKLKRYGIHTYRTDKMGMVTIWYVGNVNYIFP
ncbi:MAG: DNA internalization-related competence protein ComEC/Rec2 [Coprobacillaceae bacterium]